MTSKVLIKLALLSAIVVPSLATAHRADACGVFFEAGRAPAKVAPKAQPQRTPSNALEIAQTQIEAGSYAGAASTLATTFPNLKDAKETTSANARAVRLMALALVRSEGAAGSTQFVTGTADQKLANVQWAIGALRTLNQHRTNDPALQADLGEALSHVPSLQDEARKTLGELADKDLIGSGHAYAALAKLHAVAGDRSSSESALGRCKLMAVDKGICKVPEVVEGKALALLQRS